MHPACWKRFRSKVAGPLDAIDLLRELRGDSRLPPTAPTGHPVLFELRNALKAGDVWLADSQRYAEVETALVPTAAVSSARLAVPLDGLHGGRLHIERLEKAVPDGAEDLTLALYRDMPQTRITDLLLEVDDRIEFTSAFTDLRTGIPCRDRVGVLSHRSFE
jgi:hypothetical protein